MQAPLKMRERWEAEEAVAAAAAAAATGKKAPTSMRMVLLLLLLLACCGGVNGRNLALGRPSEQSSTLWNYNSELATDRDPDTCSFTPKSSGQRWWQVDLEHEYTVQAVAVTIAQDSYQHFTLFVIEKDHTNRTSFIKCESFNGSFAAARVMLQCPGKGIKGHKVYLRDDRKESDQLKLCEVEAFGYRDDEDPVAPCPPVSLRNGVAVVKASPDGRERAEFRCNDRFVLWGSPEVECDGRTDGRWHPATFPTCQPISCGEPDPYPDALGTMEKLNFSTNLMSEVGDGVAYTCEDGFQIVKNTTEGMFIVQAVGGICGADGKWQIEELFLCVNRTVISEGANPLIAGAAAVMPLECVVYTLVVAVLLVLLIVIGCVLGKAHTKRREKVRRRCKVTQPRFVLEEAPYGSGNASASQLLFPDLKAKEAQTSASADSSTTSSGVGAQITGYSHRQLLFDGEMNAFAAGGGGGCNSGIVRGHSVDNVGRKVLQMGVAAVDQAITPQERSQGAEMMGGGGGLTPQMTTFKPIVENHFRAHYQLNNPFVSATPGNEVATPVHTWRGVSMSHNELISLPPNWSSQQTKKYTGPAALTLPPPPKTRYEDEIPDRVVVRHSLHAAPELQTAPPASSAPTSFLHVLSMSHSGEIERVEPPANFSGSEIEDQPRYCNVTGPTELRDSVPEIDEAGYASLIIGPNGKKTVVEIDTGRRIKEVSGPKYLEIDGPVVRPVDVQNAYQNVSGDESRARLLGNAARVAGVSENPYVNDGNAAAAGSPATATDTYARVDMSKKKKEQSGVYRVAEVANEKLGHPEDPDEAEDGADLIERFESFFAPGAHFTANV